MLTEIGSAVLRRIKRGDPIYDLNQWSKGLRPRRATVTTAWAIDSGLVEMPAYYHNSSNDLTSMPSRSDAKARTRWRRLNASGLALYGLILIITLFVCAGLLGCGTSSSSGKGSAPTISSFMASPTTINAGASSTLSWATAGATSITVTPGTFTSTSASGSTSMSPIATTTYTLTATNAAGSATSTLTVTVSTTGKPIIGSFTANPSSITSGSSSTFSWATTGATSIAITPGTFTATSASGSTSVSPTATTTYTLTATNASGSATSTAKVTVGSVRRSVGNNDHFVPRRNPRRGVCRLHNRRQRRLSAIHLFRKHECQLSSIAGGDVARYGDRDRQQLADRRPRHLHARCL